MIIQREIVEVEKRKVKETKITTEFCKYFAFTIQVSRKNSTFSFYYSSSFQRSSPISKFEKTFEAIRKNERDCKETLRRYNFRKPKKEAGPSEQVGPISIFDSKEEKQKDDLQQEQEAQLHQKEPNRDQILEKIHIPNNKRMKKTNWQAIVVN